MKNIIITIAVLLGVLIGITAGDSIAGASPRISVNDIGADRFAHFGISYVINDQLQRSAHMSPFAATLATIAIGAAKEQWIDDHFDKGDFAADCAGALFYQVKF